MSAGVGCRDDTTSSEALDIYGTSYMSGKNTGAISQATLVKSSCEVPSSAEIRAMYYSRLTSAI